MSTLQRVCILITASTIAIVPFFYLSQIVIDPPPTTAHGLNENRYTHNRPNAQTNVYTSVAHLTEPVSGIGGWKLTREEARRILSADPPLVRFFPCNGPVGHWDCRFHAHPFHTHAIDFNALVDLFGAWSRFAEKESIEYFIVHGTLLGWYWGKSQMPFDDDIDIAMNWRVMDRILMLHNGTLIENRYLIEIAPLYMSRKTTKFRIDAQVIDIHIGVKMDITAFSYFKGSLTSHYKTVDQIVSAAITPSTLVRARDPHTFRLDMIYPLIKTTFEGHLAWVPSGWKNMLKREFRHGMTSREYDGFRYDETFRRFIPESDAARHMMDLGNPSLRQCPHRPQLPWSAYQIPSHLINIGFAKRDWLANNPEGLDAYELNDAIEPTLNMVDVDNTLVDWARIERNSTIDPKAPVKRLKLIELNLERGRDWCKAAHLIRNHPDLSNGDIFFLNEFDLGMARSRNEHTARMFAHALGLNYAWGVEFLELTHGKRKEQEEIYETRHGEQCPESWAGNQYSGMVDAWGLHGNAILSKWPLYNVSVVRFPGVDFHYAADPNTWLTDHGYEKRLGNRMALFAHIDLPDDKGGTRRAVVSSFHMQATWDVGQGYQRYGRHFVRLFNEKIREYNPDRDLLDLTGGDGWKRDAIGTKKHNWLQGEPLNYTLLNPRDTAGDWIAVRGHKSQIGTRRIVSTQHMSDHDIFIAEINV